VNIINSAKNRRKRRDWLAGNYQPASAIELKNPGGFAREPNLVTFIAAFRLSPGRFAAGRQTSPSTLRQFSALDREALFS
jgi:hypothetical protein